MKTNPGLARGLGLVHGLIRSNKNLTGLIVSIGNHGQPGTEAGRDGVFRISLKSQGLKVPQQIQTYLLAIVSGGFGHDNDKLFAPEAAENIRFPESRCRVYSVS